MNNPELHKEILALLKERSNMSEEDQSYINPNFLVGISQLLYDYYECEDNGVGFN